MTHLRSPKVQPASLYEPPETDDLVKVHIAESKHSKASANYTHFAHTNLACVLDIIDTVPDTIVAHLYLDDKDIAQALALKMLQALDKCFAATDAVNITAIFDVPYDTGGTIDVYLRRQNNCIKNYMIPGLHLTCTWQF